MMSSFLPTSLGVRNIRYLYKPTFLTMKDSLVIMIDKTYQCIIQYFIEFECNKYYFRIKVLAKSCRNSCVSVSPDGDNTNHIYCT